MKSIRQLTQERPWFAWMLFFTTMLVVFLLGLLASSIMERRAEAVYAYKPKVEISDFESRNFVWGENFPTEYESYLKTSDTTFKSLYNGSGLRDMLAEDPKLVILWNGYAFSKDYNQPRGHYYAVTDVRNTLRTGAPMNDTAGPQPGTCWSCKSPDVPRLMNIMPIAEFYHFKWGKLGSEVVNPIGCLNCHDPKTLNLRITQPALLEAFERQKINVKKFTQLDMRTLVCAQCHVEYYFKGDGKYLTFPWDHGNSVDSIEKYYDSYGFTDWVHGWSKTPMLKAQHPDYEMFKTSIHYQRGVACADCHMPYKSAGGVKFTDHHVQSPLNNIANSCQVCHRDDEETLRNTVYDRQRKVLENRDKTEDVICKAHWDAKIAWEAGATESEMKPVLQLIRQAQWRWDFVAAGHGNSFHAPVECLRILGNAINKAQDARLLILKILAKHNYTKEIVYPDYSSKEKAQKLIGVDLDKLKNSKKEFLDKKIPEWIKNAEIREKTYPVKRL